MGARLHKVTSRRKPRSQFRMRSSFERSSHVAPSPAIPMSWNRLVTNSFLAVSRVGGGGVPQIP